MTIDAAILSTGEHDVGHPNFLRQAARASLAFWSPPCSQALPSGSRIAFYSTRRSSET